MVSIIAIGLIVLAATVVGFLVSTFVFAFSSGQGRMVRVVNTGALAMVGLDVVVAAIAWRFDSASAALKWTAIAAAVGWFSTIVIEFVLSFSLGA